MINHMELKCSICNHLLSNCLCDEYEEIEKDLFLSHGEDMEDDIKKRKI